jgi:hypothetical protein
MAAFPVAAEATVRVALVLGVAAVATRLEWFAWGSAVSTFVSFAILAASPQARQALWARVDVGGAVLIRRITSAAVGQGTNALLVAGFPLLLGLSLTTSESTTQAARYAALTFGIQLARAPLLIPVGALQGVAVSHFTRHRERGVRAALPVIALMLGVGLVGVVLAWFIGPWLLQVLTPHILSGWELALLTAGATMIAMLTLTGVLCQSSARYQWYLAGWITALLVTFAILLTPQNLGTRTAMALICGPVVGIIVHLVGLGRRSERINSPEVG